MAVLFTVPTFSLSTLGHFGLFFVALLFAALQNGT